MRLLGKFCLRAKSDFWPWNWWVNLYMGRCGFCGDGEIPEPWLVQMSWEKWMLLLKRSKLKLFWNILDCFNKGQSTFNQRFSFSNGNNSSPRTRHSFTKFLMKGAFVWWGKNKGLHRTVLQLTKLCSFELPSQIGIWKHLRVWTISCYMPSTLCRILGHACLRKSCPELTVLQCFSQLQAFFTL